MASVSSTPSDDQPPRGDTARLRDLIDALSHQSSPDPDGHRAGLVAAADRATRGESIADDTVLLHVFDLLRDLDETAPADTAGSGPAALAAVLDHVDATDWAARLDGRRPEDTPWIISGLAGAESFDIDTVAPHVAAPVHDLPPVRGRRHLIESVHELCRLPGSVGVLVGAAGFGKSTVALAVARQADIEGRTALWVPASDSDALLEGLRLAAIRLGATAFAIDSAMRCDPENRIDQLWQLLDAAPQPWVLVLDAVDRPAVGSTEWIHRSGTGAVLLTSRYGNQAAWGPETRVFDVGSLEPAAGAQLVLDCLSSAGVAVGPDLEAPARQLCEQLLGMPLALISAGSVVASGIGDWDLAGVVEHFETRAECGPMEKAYELALACRGPAATEVARTMLRLVSCFAPGQPLPRCLFNRLGGSVEERWAGWKPILRDLTAVRLVEALPVAPNTSSCIRIHPAVAECSRRDVHFDTAAAVSIDMRAVGMLTEKVSRLDPGRPTNWDHLRRLEPHVHELAASPALQHDPELAAAALSLADTMAVALVRAGNQPAATSLLETAIQRTWSLGSQHPTMLNARHRYAWLTAHAGDLTSATWLLCEVLEQKRTVLGDRHPDTLTTLDCLAWAEAEQDEVVSARARFETVLTMRTRALGPRHPETLATRHRRAWVWSKSGEHTAAAAELVDVLRLRREVLGSDHMDVYSTRYRLAWALNLAGKHDEAARRYQDLCADLSAIVGVRHPLPLMVRARLARIAVWLNRFSDAEEMYSDLLADQKAVLGNEHPRVIRTQHHFAHLKLKLGDTAQAEAALREAYHRRQELLGSHNRFTMESREVLALAVMEEGRAEEALDEFDAAVKARRMAQRDDHPMTLRARWWRARVLIRLGRFAEAHSELDQVLECQRLVLPPDDRHVLDTRHTLASVRVWLGDPDGALVDLRAVLRERERVLVPGPAHVESLATRDHIVWALGNAGRIEEAGQEARALLEEASAALGPRHPRTFATRYRLAWLAGLSGRHETALLELQKLLGDLRLARGERNLVTLRCRAAIVRALRLTGSLDEARAEARDLMRERGRPTPINEPDTVSVRDELRLLGG